MTIQSLTAPLITVSDQPILEGEFRWQLTRGAEPFFTSVVVTNASADILRQKENPHSIRVRIDQRPNKVEFDIDNVFIVEERQQNEFHKILILADSRWFAFTNAKLYMAYNITRDSISVQNALNLPNININNTSTIREAYDQFSIGRYLPDSVKSDGRPFTMDEILIMELSKFYPNVFSHDENKTSYVVENVIYEGVPAIEALNELSSRARLGISLGLDNNMYIYSLDFSDEKAVVDFLKKVAERNKLSPDLVYLQENSRNRPGEVFVRYRIEQEVVLQAPPNREIINQLKQRYREVESGTNGLLPVGGAQKGQPTKTTPLPLLFTPRGKLAISARENVIPADEDGNDTEVSSQQGSPLVAVYNVIRAPFKPKNSKFLYNVNEWVPLVIFLEDIGVTEEDVRKRYWNDSLALFLTQKVFSSADTLDPFLIRTLGYSTASAIKESYRQIYKIDTFFMDRIEYWETRRCGVIDPFSGYRHPSPLYADYAIFANNVPTDLLKNPLIEQDVLQIYNYDLNKLNPDRKIVPPGTITMLDKKLGVFRVSYPYDITGTIGQFVPSMIEGNPLNYQSDFTFTVLQEDHPLAEEFTLESIITASFWYNPFILKIKDFDSPARYKTFKFVNSTGEGPPLDYLSDYMTAQINFLGEVTNQELLEDLAQAESAKLSAQYRDRAQGFIVIPAFVPMSFTGNMNFITYVFNRDLGFTTTIDMLNNYEPQITFENVNPQTLKFIMKQVT